MLAAERSATLGHLLPDVLRNCSLRHDRLAFDLAVERHIRHRTGRTPLGWLAGAVSHPAWGSRSRHPKPALHAMARPCAFSCKQTLPRSFRCMWQDGLIACD